MNMQQVRAIAREQGVKTGKLSKADLIRSIQLHEGNFDCFGRAPEGTCNQLNCLWRSDCLPEKK